MIVLEIIATVFVADFVSGFFHWLEDAYGREHWPITGRLITRPNVLHHHDPRYFIRHGWLHSSWLLFAAGLLVLGIAWLCGVLTWHVWLFVLLGSNANEFHKWAHRENGSRAERVRLARQNYEDRLRDFLSQMWITRLPQRRGMDEIDVAFDQRFKGRLRLSQSIVAQ